MGAGQRVRPRALLRARSGRWVAGTLRNGGRLPAEVLLAALLAAAFPRRACAAAGQWQAGARAGVAWLESAGWGPSTEAFLRHGLGDRLDLDVQVSTSFHPFQQDKKMAASSAGEVAALPWALGVAPALLYRWDVLRVIPFAGAGVGVTLSEGSDSVWDGTQFGASARAGVEYLLSRDVVLSAQLGALLPLTESPLPAPWIQFGVGAAYVWGW